MNKIKIQKINSNAKLLTKAYPGDAGYDLYCYEDICISPNSIKKINTGIKIELPKGLFGMIADRSSIASIGLKVMGGIIDNGYRGEIIVMLLNTTSSYIYLNKYHKIAQMLIFELKNLDLEEGEVKENSKRGSKGFGSSNK